MAGEQYHRDWAPYSRMRDNGGRAEWTRGITGSVYLALTTQHTVAIDEVSPKILYKGTPPVKILKDDGTHVFEVNVTAHVAAKAAQGTLKVTGSWGVSKSVPLMITAATYEARAVSVVLEASSVRLWWPHNMGEQVLYKVHVEFFPSDSALGTVSAERRIGFRTAFLTTGTTAVHMYM
eukprot:SAG31_NODE_1211_length_9376_cov_2.931767_5_plen_178_part_00